MDDDEDANEPDDEEDIVAGPVVVTTAEAASLDADENASPVEDEGGVVGQSVAFEKGTSSQPTGHVLCVAELAVAVVFSTQLTLPGTPEDCWHDQYTVTT